jgi:hypothetical protein
MPLADRQLGTARSGALRPAAVFGAVGGMEAERLQGEPHPAAAPGLDPVELVVDAERFVVTRRADSPGTYDFDWISHPASYGFTIGANFEWRPDQAELTGEIHHFLADVDPKTGYLPD